MWEENGTATRIHTKWSSDFKLLKIVPLNKKFDQFYWVRVSTKQRASEDRPEKNARGKFKIYVPKTCQAN